MPFWPSSASAPPASRWCRRCWRSNRADKRMQGAAGRHPGQPPPERRGAQPRHPPQGDPADAQEPRPRRCKSPSAFRCRKIFQAGMRVDRRLSSATRSSSAVIVSADPVGAAGAAALRRRSSASPRGYLLPRCSSAAGARGIRPSSSTNCPTPSKPSCAASSPACRSTIPCASSPRKPRSRSSRSSSASLDQQSVGKSMTEAVPESLRPHAAARGQLLRRRHPCSSRRAATSPKRWATCRACCATARR